MHQADAAAAMLQGIDVLGVFSYSCTLLAYAWLTLLGGLHAWCTLVVGLMQQQCCQPVAVEGG